MVASMDLEPQRIDLQFGPNVIWSPAGLQLTWAAADLNQGASERVTPVRAMYARLARAYGSEPAVPDHGGGVRGDRFPF